MSRLKNKTIGITLGDPAGIGAEVVAKALSNPTIRKLANFKIIGHAEAYQKFAKKNYSNCSIVNVGNGLTKNLKYGQPTKKTALASVQYLDKAIEMVKHNQISGIVTAPVCKEAIHSLGQSFLGHTEYLGKAFHVKNLGMMFVCDELRTIIVTRHLPIDKVSRSINTKNIFETIDLTNSALKKYFRIRKPSIGVCGLNPHAGEGGTLGKEEITKISPAIAKAVKKGINIKGPFAADTLFSPETSRNFDAIVAMYHDQGLIPVKTLHFNKLVNLTIGLPFVRTSPAHGTAFNIAGQNKANASSMAEAIKLAIKLSR